MTIDAHWLKDSYGDISKPNRPRMIIKTWATGSINPVPNMAGWDTPWHFFTSALAKFATHPYERCAIINNRCFIYKRDTEELFQEIWFEDY